jgi:eukaryotic-like serine/threonine-protein kinase
MTDFGPLPVHAGDLIAGKYRVEGVIGVGGMGIVVAARHEQLDQRVAIKFVRNPSLGNNEGVERFLREARAAVRLKSEHAARVLDVGALDSGVPFMVMELLEGNDLAQVLEERGPVSVAVAADWIVQACEALAEAHAAGIVHRDLKPQNLFLARTVGGATKIKVLDFGVAKSVESMASGPGALTQTRAMLGSPIYMAPEQMRSSRDVDARADVWALGVVLFELLTRRCPYEADTLPELCLKVVTDPPMSIRKLLPEAPATIVEVIDRCLERDVSKRFANAAELASALEPVVPPASRLFVERARLAVSEAPRGSTASPSRLKVAEGQGQRTPRTPPTPAAWGAGNDAARRKRRGQMVLVAAGVIVAAATGVFLAHVRASGRPSAAVGPAARSPTAWGDPTALTTVATVATAPLPVVTLSPTAAEAPATMNDRAEAGGAPSVRLSSASPAPMAPSQYPVVPGVPARVISQPEPPRGTAGASGPQEPAARPALTGKTSTRDDDIPSLR